MLIGFMATCAVAWPQTEASFEVKVDVQAIARIGISGPSALDLAIAPLGVAGEPPAVATSDATYVQYTSTVPTGGERVLQARLLEPLPAGAKLELRVKPPESGGAGDLGSSLDYRTLSNSVATVMEGIGACTSGNGGGRLYYRLSAGNIAQLRAAVTSITVELTLTDVP